MPYLLSQAKLQLIYSLLSGLFLKSMQAGVYFSFLINQLGPCFVATETMIWCPNQTQNIHLQHLFTIFYYRISSCLVLPHIIHTHKHTHTLNIRQATIIHSYYIYGYYRYHVPRRMAVVYTVLACLQIDCCMWEIIKYT